MCSYLEQKIYVSCYDGCSILYHYRIIYSMYTSSLPVCLCYVYLFILYVSIDNYHKSTIEIYFYMFIYVL